VFYCVQKCIGIPDETQDLSVKSIKLCISIPMNTTKTLVSYTMITSISAEDYVHLKSSINCNSGILKIYLPLNLKLL
jgi:hypothetical protein